MGLLQTFLHITNFRSPFLRTLAPSAAAAFAIQTAFAIPSIAAQSERFYDASGALTFLSVTLLSLYLPSLRAQSAGAATKLPGLLSPFFKSFGTAGAGSLNWRQVALSGAVAFWSIRCKTMRAPSSQACHGTWLLWANTHTQYSGFFPL